MNQLFKASDFNFVLDKMGCFYVGMLNSVLITETSIVAFKTRLGSCIAVTHVRPPSPTFTRSNWFGH